MTSPCPGQFTPTCATLAPVASVIHRPDVLKGVFGHTAEQTWTERASQEAATPSSLEVFFTLIVEDW